MAQAVVQLTRRRFGETMRRDAWWLPPLGAFVVLSSFLAYATWAAFQNANYEYGPYLSPFYSPLLFGKGPHSWFGPVPGWWPGAIPFSAALLILWAPGGFRFTCYYYRGAYYKAFWADPPSCGVGEPRSSYRGEHSFPLILQNVHRYFMLLAIGFIVMLAYDAWKAMWFANPATGTTTFGVGLGTLVLVLNVILLSGYTFGCHSLRHSRLGELSLSDAIFCADRELDADAILPWDRTAYVFAKREGQWHSLGLAWPGASLVAPLTVSLPA